VNVYPMKFSFVADHFQYLASIALIVAITGGATTLIQRAGSARIGIACASIVLAFLAFQTWRQARVYHDRQSLWEDTLAKNPDCWMAHNHLAYCLLQAGDTDGAMAHARESLRLRPDHAEAHNTVGRIFVRLNEPDQAITEYREALRLKPKLATAQVNWGAVLGRAGDPVGAAEHFAIAAQLNPRYVDAFCNWGLALEAQHRDDDAMQKFRDALRIAPANLRAHVKLASQLHKRGDDAAAKACYEMAIHHHPDSAEAADGLAILLLESPNPQIHDLPCAIKLAERACELSNREDSQMLTHLASAYAINGQIAKADDAAREAIAVADALNESDRLAELKAWREMLRQKHPSFGTARATD